MPATDIWPILRTGVWLYAGITPVEVRILQSNETWGTGDYEDEESVRENGAVECFFLAYEKAASPGIFSNLVPNLPTLEEAITHAEEMFPGIQWQVA